MHKVKSSFPLEPHFERLIVKVDPVKSKSDILVMGDDVQAKSNTGTVIAIGPIVERDTSIRPGNRIMFEKFAGQPLEWDGVEYLRLMANDVLFTIHQNQQDEKDSPAALRSV